MGRNGGGSLLSSSLRTVSDNFLEPRPKTSDAHQSSSAIAWPMSGGGQARPGTAPPDRMARIHTPLPVCHFRALSRQLHGVARYFQSPLLPLSGDSKLVTQHRQSDSEIRLACPGISSGIEGSSYREGRASKMTLRGSLEPMVKLRWPSS
jgi:hypothetical protein